MISAPIQILQALDEEQRISSKWIATALNKRHDNVIRDIDVLKNEDSSNLRNVISIFDQRGFIAEIRMTLTFAILLLSLYRGPKSTKARILILEALDYFLHRAPKLEAELSEAKRKLAEAQQKQLKKPTGKNKGSWLVPIYAEPLFDDGLNQKVIIAYDRKTLDELSPKQAVIVQLEHVRAIMHGVQKKEQEIFGRLVADKDLLQ